MSQSMPMEPYEPAGAAADYRRQSLEFLGRAREYLARGDLHQAAEKGWAAAAWMVKAVAETQGWEYEKHPQFFTVMRQARQLSGDARLRPLGDAANTLHGCYYTRKRFLSPDDIGEGIEDMALLLAILQLLTEG